MRILVTGAGGFIGSWLVPELQAHGHLVYTTDIEDGNSDYPNTDLTQAGEFAAILDAIDVDSVIHLAAQVGRIRGEDDLIHTVQSNAQMTALIANECKSRDLRLLYVSSSEIYGDQDVNLVDEYEGPFSVPHNLYGLSKRWGEEVCQMYVDPDKLMIARLSMPYGPGAPPGRGRRAMDNFLWWAQNLMPITVHEGSERSWCWVGDTVRGLRLILEKGDGIYNVGRDDAYITMHELAIKACDLNDSPKDLIRLVEPPNMQTIVKYLKTDRLRHLGWQPTVELEEGLEAVNRWVENFDIRGNQR